MKRYVVYGMGDYKSKEWFIYDTKFHFLLPNYKFKLKRTAQKEADKLNGENTY